MKSVKAISRTTKSIIYMGVGLFVNLALALSKFFVGYACGSLTIVMDSINNFIDLVFNIVAVVAFVIIRKKEDENMPQGYGRAEYVASFLLSIFIMFTGVYFLIRSLQNVMIPVNLTFQWKYIIILIVSILVKIGMGVLFAFANRNINSYVFKGVMWDSFIDGSITLLALIGFVLSKYLITLDAVFGIGISIIFIALSIRLMVTNFRVLIGQDNLEESKKEILIETLNNSECVKEIKGIQYHDYGFGKITATVRLDIELENIQDVCELKKELEEKLGIRLVFDFI